MKNKELKEALDKLHRDFPPPDCQNNPCHYGLSKGGMRTNSRCRCIDNNPREVERYCMRLKKLLLEFTE